MNSPEYECVCNIARLYRDAEFVSGLGLEPVLGSSDTLSQLAVEMSTPGRNPALDTLLTECYRDGVFCEIGNSLTDARWALSNLLLRLVPEFLRYKSE